MPLKTTVPIDIRPAFEKSLGRETEAWSMSSSRNRTGDPGETWLVATKTRLLVGDRGFGGPIAIREIPLRDITACELEGGSYGAGRVVLAGKAGALDHVCFSSLERDEFARLGERLRPGPAPADQEARVLGPAKAASPPAARPAPEKKTPGFRAPLPPRTARVPPGGAFDLFLDRPFFFPGQPVTGVLRLHWPRDRAVRGVRLYWRGQEKTRVTVGSGKNQTTYHETCTWASYRIGFFGAPDPLGFFGAVGDAASGALHPVLKSGVYEYPFRFELPEGAPPNYAGSGVEVTWMLEAIVDIPRAFDLTVRFPARVVPPVPDRQRGRETRKRGSVTLVGWLNAGPIEPGQKVTGGFRLENPSGKTVRGVDVRVLRMERATAKGRTRVNEVVERAIRFRGQTGVDVPFEVELPLTFCPWVGHLSQVWYEVDIAVDVAWAFDVDVRLEVP